MDMSMSLPDFRDFYWTVGASSSNVYSSKSNTYVDIEDPDYVAFLNAGNYPTRIANEAELWDVISGPLGLPGWMFNGETFSQPAASKFSKAQLKAYANIVQWSRAVGGHVVMIDGSPVPFSTSEASMSLLAGKAMRLQQPNPPSTVRWQVSPTSFKLIEADDFIVAASSVADFVQSTFDRLDEVFSMIDDGTVTTPDGVENAFD